MADEHYLVLARKWRPQCFEDVVGQEHITRTLQNAITAGRIGHAFLFIGSRGIGKTTTARVLCKALNCLSVEAPTPDPCGECDNCTSIAAGNSLDVIEIDGASNNSVEDVRQIRDNIRMVPSRSRYKVYVIDEVHQLSTSAFNALLKTLEEPPEHAVFILATTEAHKIPATIISRCQRYDFRRVGRERVCDLLRRILDKEGIKCSDEALLAIARAADGGVRDAESILEQLISYCDDEITFREVFDVLGLVDWQVLNDLCDAILTQDIGAELTIVEDIVVSGKDLSQFVEDILSYLRNLLVCKTADPHKLLALPTEEIAAMETRAAKFTLTQLIGLVEQFAELTKDFDSQIAQRVALETLLIRVSKVAVEVSVDTVMEKLVQLGAGGIGAPEGIPAAAKTQPVPEEVPPSHPRVTPAAPEAPAPSAKADAPPTPEPSPPAPDPAPVRKKVPRKITVDPDNLREQWHHLAEAAGNRSLNLGISLAHATPLAIDSGMVTLLFDADNARARDYVEQPANRTAIEELFAERTENVTGFCAKLAAPVEAEAPQEAEEYLPFGGGVSREQAKQALEEPDVAKVVDVFKGRIVDIKRTEDHAATE